VRRDERGFTLLELVIALAIVGALLVIAFTGLRVGLAAWSQGEDRAEAHQHLRSVAMVLERSLGAAYPYRASLGDAPDPVLLFKGAEDRLEFVTQAPPLPAAIPVAFTAVVIAIERDENGRDGLVIRERVLPNRDPFTEAKVVLRDPAIQTLKFRYLTVDGAWQDAWDAENEASMPNAVQVAVSAKQGSRTESLPPVTVGLRVLAP
jgi:general secretion pathway protein J